MRLELTMEQLDTLEEEPGVADLMDVMEELMEVLERMELCIMEELVLETLSLNTVQIIISSDQELVESDG